MMNPKIPLECVLIDHSFHEKTIYGEEQGFKDSLGRYDNITPDLCLEIGLDILQNKDIPEKNFLIFQGATLLHYLFEIDFKTAKNTIETVISNYSALNHWNNLK